MAAPRLAYPAPRHVPTPRVDLTARAERERLSPAALRGFANIMARWQVCDEDARALLGGAAPGPSAEWKQRSGRVLDADALTRVSYVVGIFKALHVVHGQALADAWVRLPNANPVFGGQTPLTYLLGGGLPALRTVRRLLDARRAGQ